MVLLSSLTNPRVLIAPLFVLLHWQEVAQVQILRCLCTDHPLALYPPTSSHFTNLRCLQKSAATEWCLMISKQIGTKLTPHIFIFSVFIYLFIFISATARLYIATLCCVIVLMEHLLFVLFDAHLLCVWLHAL